MQRTDFVADAPEGVWAVFEPTLPPVVWQGVGRKPTSNRACLPALPYVLSAGSSWELLPKGCPSSKTVQRRLRRWLALDGFHAAWQQLAQRYVRRHGRNWDQVKPPAAAVPGAQPDPRALPHARADGADGNRPSQARAAAAGFGLEAPKRGRARQPGVGRIRCAVERCHACWSPFGRIARRLDRTARRYLGWVQLAACVIFLRHEAKGFVR
jgi:transposase